MFVKATSISSGIVNASERSLIICIHFYHFMSDISYPTRTAMGGVADFMRMCAVAFCARLTAA